MGGTEVGAEYSEKNIRTLSDVEHIRMRPGMYIGRLGDGTLPEDGIYVLLKETIDNSIDEFRMKAGRRIEVTIDGDRRVGVRDYGRGIPQGKLVEAVSRLNTGGKYDSKAFKKSVGMNGVGIKAVNFLSSRFEVRSFRDGQMRCLVFEKGALKEDRTEDAPAEKTGTYISFEPDESLFRGYAYREEIVETMLRNYTYLNSGLTITFNGQKIVSRNGLEDLLRDTMTTETLYPIVHLKGEDIEIAFTHTNQYGEEYHSFVNGQSTTQGGTHQSAFKEHIARTIKEHFNRYEPADIRHGMVAAIAINVEEPIFESQTKIKLGSLTMSPGGEGINKFVSDFVKREVDNYLYKHPATAEAIETKIKESERERKAIAGVTKLARERAKKADMHNRKLRDCRIHYSDVKNPLKEESSIFITEGDSASGSITKSRDVNTQAVFSLRGKPLNSFGLTRRVVYENEEFNLLQAALDIEEGLDGLRYNKVIIATDADVDGMHIRLLAITFFLQFFPELIKKGHVYVLQTPLFRVRNRRAKIKDKKVIATEDAKLAERGEQAKDFITRYCYSEEERQEAIRALAPDAEITRFKGLGEISPEEFSGFIGADIRLEQVTLHKTDQVEKLLSFYMGRNTPERQRFIIENLVVEEDVIEEEV
ncbi:MAG: type IIA DNA topoisomerase subunit B [Prevotella sp.]|nr:type IIA DNA topoisomerase subunit B [Prevotella sp.]